MNRRQFLQVMGVTAGVGAAVAISATVNKKRDIKTEKGTPIVKDPIEARFEIKSDEIVISLDKEHAKKTRRVFVNL